MYLGFIYYAQLRNTPFKTPFWAPLGLKTVLPILLIAMPGIALDILLISVNS